MPLLLASLVAAAVFMRELLRVRELRGLLLAREAQAYQGARTVLPGTLFALQSPPFLAWARRDRIPLAVVIFTINAPQPGLCAQAMRSVMRRHEPLYDFGAGTFVALLWNCPAENLGYACHRIARESQRGEPWSVRVGTAMLDTDGDQLPALIERARSTSVELWELEVPELRASFDDPQMRAPLPWHVRAEIWSAAHGRSALIAACVTAAIFALPRLGPEELPLLLQGAIVALSGSLLIWLSWSLIPLHHLSRAALAALGIGAMALGQLPVPPLQTVCRTLAGVAVGAIVHRLLDRRDLIAPVLLLASIADIWSVYAQRGVTRRIAESDGILERVFVPGPWSPDGPMYVLGLVDIVFAAAMLVWVARWNLHHVRTVACLAGAMGLSLALVGLLPAGIFIPAIPLLTLGMLVANPVLLRDPARSFRLARERARHELPATPQPSPASQWP